MWPGRSVRIWAPTWDRKPGAALRNGCLVCPFHGFEYDVTGQCVATPYAPPPGPARLKVFHTREILGLVFAWWGSGGRPPQWKLPEAPYSPLLRRVSRWTQK